MFNITIADAVSAEATSPVHVVVGSVIKAVYLEFWLLGESAQPCTATWSFEKKPAGKTAMSFAQSQALDSYSNKNQLLKIGQGIIGDSNSNPIPIVREWIPIPKGKQRMAQDDDLMLNISTVGQTDNGLQTCGLAIYKEYQ